MVDQRLVEEISNISLSMFRKSFFGVHHGSISARLGNDLFLINTKEAIFDEITEETLIKLDGKKRDYRWNIASIDAPIHDEIYRQVPHAKYIAYAIPPYISAYSLTHDLFRPQDYFGDKFIGEIETYDPKCFSDWYDRAPCEIADLFKTNSTQLILIKGYGVYTYDRDLIEIAKKIAILENSARLLTLNSDPSLCAHSF